MIPAENQVEIQPHCTRNDLREYCKKEGIFVQVRKVRSDSIWYSNWLIRRKFIFSSSWRKASSYMILAVTEWKFWDLCCCNENLSVVLDSGIRVARSSGTRSYQRACHYKAERKISHFSSGWPGFLVGGWMVLVLELLRFQVILLAFGICQGIGVIPMSFEEKLTKQNSEVRMNSNSWSLSLAYPWAVIL